MAAPASPFRRIILGVDPTSPDGGMRLAAEVARLLQLDLLGLFIKDTNLFDLAGLPFAREFRPYGGGWHSIDLEQISRDLDLAARTAERLFTDAARRSSVAGQFEVVRGSAADTLASRSRQGDIVLVVEPSSPSHHAIRHLSEVTRAALRPEAAVLMAPTQMVDLQRAVVAIAAGPGDPSIAMGLVLSQMTKGDLTVVEAVDRGASEARSVPASHAAERGAHRTVRRERLADPAALRTELRDLARRFVVMTRGAFDESVPRSIVSALDAPVLLVEPRPGEPVSEP